ncbi:MAG: hypothetical protein KGY41_05695, partial [Desulfovermiculus sp.]|nr:hypothetical protein [Desulfovermiculus sp.]
TQDYVRHRDIWDLRWLKQNGAVIKSEWVMYKIKDYRATDYQSKLESLWRDLPAIVHGEAFKSEMTRFLPMDVQERTLRKNKFCDFLTGEIRAMLDTVREALARA